MTSTKHQRLFLLFLLLTCCGDYVVPTTTVLGFSFSSSSRWTSNQQQQPSSLSTQLYVEAESSSSSSSSSSNFLMAEFKDYKGDLLDPYQVLKLHRSADRKEIRQKYINLSRRYHPDVVMHKDILPGSWYVLQGKKKTTQIKKISFNTVFFKPVFFFFSLFYQINHSNNLDDVRDQWERIKLAYEILSDNRMRKRYDRHEVISDPKAAVQRAATDAVGNAAKNVGQGIFNIGKGLLDFGAKAITESMENSNSNNNKPATK